MASIKIVLRNKPKADGTCPLTIRVIKDRKSSFVYLGYHILPEHWDEKNARVRKSHPNATRLNNFLAKKLAEAADTSLKVETEKKTASVQAIKREITLKDSSSIFAHADAYLKRLEDEGKFNRWKPDSYRVKHFKAFLKHDRPLSEVNAGLLRDFMHHLYTKRKVGERTVMNYLMVIQSIFSYAIQHEVIPEGQTPFGAGKNKIQIKHVKSSKIGISSEDVEKMERVSLSGMPDDARNVWLMAYYFAGMRVSDVLKLRWSDFYNGRLHYTMKKNGKPGSVKIPEQVNGLLARYEKQRKSPDDYIFPGLKILPPDADRFLLEKRIDKLISDYNEKFRLIITPKAGITGKVSMHIARHTFATLAGDKVHPRILQELYRHANISTTMEYQKNFIPDAADDALDAVLNSGKRKKKSQTRLMKHVPVDTHNGLQKSKHGKQSINKTS